MSDIPPEVLEFQVEGQEQVSQAYDNIAKKSQETSDKMVAANEKTSVSTLKMGRAVAQLSTAGLQLEMTFKQVSEGQISVAEGMIRSIPAIVTTAAAMWTLIGADNARTISSAISQAVASGGLKVPIIAAAAVAGAAIGAGAVAMVPKAAKGAILTEPTLLVAGEAGPEAVVPLNSETIKSFNSEIFNSSSSKSELDSSRSVVINVYGSSPRETASEIMRHIRASGEG